MAKPKAPKRQLIEDFLTTICGNDILSDMSSHFKLPPIVLYYMSTSDANPNCESSLKSKCKKKRIELSISGQLILIHRVESNFFFFNL